MSLLEIYHRLPYPARCLAASLRGRQLARQRFSLATPQLVEEAKERESWTPERWRRWQEERLAPLLHRAATRVPYYRELWHQGGGGPEEWKDLDRWPVLTKGEVLIQPSSFLADDRRRRSLIEEHTSGSTGSPLILWRSRASNVAWYALAEARLRAWNGVRRGMPWAQLGGQLIAPVSQQRPPFWVWSRSQKQLYLSAYHLAPGNAGAYLGAMAKHRVRSLMGYPSAMAALASLALEEGAEARARDLGLAVLLSNAEPLFGHQRSVLEEVFGCPVRDTYGMAEMVCGASECEAGALHLWPEAGVLELLDDEGRPVPAGKSGRVVATGLLNGDMPLVRYEVGDTATLAEEQSCPCGRRLPILASVEGRMDDDVVTPEGRRVGRLDPVFKADFPIREAQIVQTELHRIIVRVVPTAGYGPATAERIAHALKLRLGESMTVEVEEVSALPRGPSGKLRAVISHVGQEEAP